MKKYLLFLLFLLLLPFIVKAEVKITDIDLIDSSNDNIQASEPTYEGLKIDFNLNFAEVGDYAKYLITVKNDTDKDYEIETGSNFTEGEYISYEFNFKDEVKTVKKGEELVLGITVSYAEEVPANEFENGIYQEDNALSINLASEEPKQEQVNPNTTVSSFIVIAVIVLAISFLLMLLNAHNIAKIMPILLILLIPITIYALDKITIEVKTRITIEQPVPKHFFQINYLVNDLFNGEDDVRTYEFEPGMTFGDWVLSDYNIDNLDFEEAYSACSLTGKRILYEDYDHYQYALTKHTDLIKENVIYYTKIMHMCAT